jgi:hypothetical protein
MITFQTGQASKWKTFFGNEMTGSAHEVQNATCQELPIVIQTNHSPRPFNTREFSLVGNRRPSLN